jgi:hypothetical protein
MRIVATSSVVATGRRMNVSAKFMTAFLGSRHGGRVRGLGRPFRRRLRLSFRSPHAHPGQPKLSIGDDFITG